MKKQKGVENPERFLAQGVGVNNTGITPPQPSPSGEGVLANSLQTQSEGNGLNPENQLSNDLSQNLPPQNLPPQGQFDMNTLALLLGILQQVNKEKGDKAKPEDFIKVLENILEMENNNEVQEL